MVGDKSARWAPDPLGRHQHRFWDGTAWTEYVSDRGRSSLDPFPLAGATALHTSAAPAPAPPVQRPTLSVVPPAPRPAPSPAMQGRAPHTDLTAVAAPTRDRAGGTPTEAAAESRPTRGPNRLPSHRERPSPLRRMAPSLALLTLLFAAALAMAWF